MCDPGGSQLTHLRCGVARGSLRRSNRLRGDSARHAGGIWRQRALHRDFFDQNSGGCEVTTTGSRRKSRRCGAMLPRAGASFLSRGLEGAFWGGSPLFLCLLSPGCSVPHSRSEAPSVYAFGAIGASGQRVRNSLDWPRWPKVRRGPSEMKHEPSSIRRNFHSSPSVESNWETQAGARPIREARARFLFVPSRFSCHDRALVAVFFMVRSPLIDIKRGVRPIGERLVFRALYSALSPPGIGGTWDFPKSS